MSHDETQKYPKRHVAPIHYLGVKGSAWAQPLTEWAAEHPELDAGHRPGSRSWHCRGQRVLRLERAGSGVHIVAGIDYKAPDLKPKPVEDLKGPITTDELRACRTR